MGIAGMKKTKALFRMARKDVEYRCMQQQFVLLEQKVSKLTTLLSDEAQDAVWGMLCLSDEMNMRMVKIICDHFCLWDAIEEAFGEQGDDCTDISSRA